MAEASRLAYTSQPDFSSKGTGTDGIFLSRNGSLVISFRGTDSAIDWRTNLNCDSATGVHNGFYEAYLSVRDNIKAEIEKAGKSTIFWTGHSLGGALATIGALDFATRGCHLYTFGAPRVFGIEKASDLNLCVKNRFRIVNDLDIVPLLPPEQFGFSHYSGLYYFDSFGILRDGRNLKWWARAIERAVAKYVNLFGARIPEVSDHRIGEYVRLCNQAKNPKMSWVWSLQKRGRQ